MESITSETIDLWGSFFLRTLEFSVDPNKKNKKKKMEEKVYGFSDNLIGIGNGKFSLLLPEYS